MGAGSRRKAVSLDLAPGLPIKPYAEDGAHEFRISSDLRNEYANGRFCYDLHHTQCAPRATIRLPATRPTGRPWSGWPGIWGSVFRGEIRG